MKDSHLKNGLIYITYAVFLFLVVTNLGYIWGFINKFINVSMPVIYGFIIAYVVNFLYKWIIDKVMIQFGKDGSVASKLRKPLAIIFSYFIFGALIVFLVNSLIPQLAESVNTFIDNFQSYVDSLLKWVSDIMVKLKLSPITQDEVMAKIQEFFSKFTTEDITNLISQISPHIVGITKSIGGQIYNIVLGLFISVYFIISKEELIRNLKKLSDALFSKKTSYKIKKVGAITNTIFGKFMAGKALDSIIVGILCFLGMKLLGMDYYVLIGVIVGVTNFIPFFGPFIGAIPSAFILLMVDPFQSLWFILFIFILQQIDSNILQPLIFGDSMGVSGFWVIVSCIIGGGLFGIVGLIVSLPTFSIMYMLLGKVVNKRLISKGLPTDNSNNLKPIEVELNHRAKKKHTIIKWVYKKFELIGNSISKKIKK